MNGSVCCPNAKISMHLYGKLVLCNMLENLFLIMDQSKKNGMCIRHLRGERLLLLYTNLGIMLYRQNREGEVQLVQGTSCKR